jgi:orotate phosphoribosyltransferase
MLASGTQFDFIAGNATGGMTPGYQLREDLQKLTGREIPYVYVRGSRKPGGHQELVTGVEGNPYTPKGLKALVVEELINFAQTSTNSAVGLREIGYNVDSAATILHYRNPEALKNLADNNISVVQVTSLPKLLEVAEMDGTFSPQAIQVYKTFLENPIAWQASKGLEPVQM